MEREFPGWANAAEDFPRPPHPTKEGRCVRGVLLKSDRAAGSDRRTADKKWVSSKNK